MRPAHTAYTMAWSAALAGASPYLLVRQLLHPREMHERYGDWTPLPTAALGGLWVHAASVGEGRAASGLLKALRDRRAAPFLSVVTPAARRLEAQFLVAGAEAVRFAPLDWPPCVRRVLREVHPRGLLIVETEIWPGWLAEIGRIGLPFAFVSARLSDRGFRRLRPWRRALAPLLHPARVAAQTAGDAERWLALGAQPANVRVTGNTKYETPEPPPSEAQRAALRAGWSRIVLFGSVRSGEIDAVASAIEACRDLPEHVLFIVAPRHPERTCAALRRRLAALLPLTERTKVGEPFLPPRDSFPRGDSPKQSHGVLLVGTIGELARYYAFADAAFVGGSLVPIEGHNIFEAAAMGSAVLFGPHVANVADVAEALTQSGGGYCVRDGEELGATLLRLLRDDAERERASHAALAIAERFGGALGRTLAALDGWEFPLEPRRAG
jgi:3-deoxy-D-manno-octulosonic-acid transferase